MPLVRDYILRLPFLGQLDRIFELQATDTNMRRAEISRLMRVRRNQALVCAFLFVICFCSSFLGGAGSHGSTPFIWIMFTLSMLAFYDVQNRLRLLQLAEMFYLRR